MSDFETSIVLINCETCGGNAREALEHIENLDFGGYDHLARFLETNHNIDTSAVSVLSMSEFMDSFNDTDSEGDYIGIQENFIGYIRTPKKGQA